MKISLPLILFIFFASAAFSQTEFQYGDLIVLKNGSKLYGAIIDYKIGEEVSLQLENGSIIRIKDDEIAKIDMKKHSADKMKDYSLDSERFYNVFAVKIIPGSDNSDFTKLGMGLEYSLGYRFNNYASLGGGVAAEYYNYGFDEFFFPVYMDFITFLKKNPVSPFFRFQGGYGLIHTKSEYVIDKTGGIMLNPAFGFKFQGNYGINYTLDVNFKYQEAKFTYRKEWQNLIYNRDVIFQRLIFRFGVIF